MNLPKSKERDGVIGLVDFRGDVIRAMEKAGFVYHSELLNPSLGEARPWAECWQAGGARPLPPPTPPPPLPAPLRPSRPLTPRVRALWVRRRARTSTLVAGAARRVRDCMGRGG